MKRYAVPTAATLANPSKTVKETLSLFINWKIINLLEGAEGEDEAFYYADEDKKMELEYYKNSIIHFFIPHSFVALSFLTGSEEVKSPESIISDYAFLKNLFKNEFVFDEREGLRERVISVIEYFLDSSFLSRSEENDGYKITKLGFDNLPIWAALTKTFLESYWIAVKSVSQQRDKWDKRDDLLKHMNYLGRRFHKLGIIEHIGALSRLNFTNALSFINEDFLNLQEMSEKDRSHALERLSQLGQRLYELSDYRA